MVRGARDGGDFVVDRLGIGRRVAAVRGVFAVLWTASLIGAIVAVDRGCIPKPREGWYLALSLDQRPSQVRFRGIPTYLPSELQWPPVRIFFREAPASGWWYGLGSKEGGFSNKSDPVLWMGGGDAPLPAELSRFSSCLHFRTGPDREQCPEGWVSFQEKVGEEVISIVTRMDPAQARRILNALEVPALEK